jgi:dethiobiotin synthetase
MMKPALFVTGTDTNVGKTVLSALLCVALDATYWKPIQTGNDGLPEGIDRLTVMRLAGLPQERTLPERYLFGLPVSPHLAAREDGATIDLADIRLPKNPGGRLIIEGAGGVLVPVNDSQLMIDLIRHLNVPALVAARSSLGTINHTLLTVEALRARSIEIVGVVAIGNPNTENEHAIEHYGDVAIVGRVPHLEVINPQVLLDVYHTRFNRTVFE